jgi:ABC-type multidrug transport system ATPase subunit
MLVTHSMEEAELLADNIIVMQRGEIVAAGTPLRLKSKYGAGYRLSLTSTSPVEDTRPPAISAKLESCAAGEVIWRIEDATDLGKVVKWADEMERKCTANTEENGAVKITGWEVSMPTLEEVLLEKKLF